MSLNAQFRCTRHFGHAVTRVFAPAATVSPKRIFWISLEHAEQFGLDVEADVADFVDKNYFWNNYKTILKLIHSRDIVKEFFNI